jgi:hypothetical protein
VKLLEQAWAAGYFRDADRLARLQREPAFAALRGRDEFRRLAAPPTGPEKDR